MSEFVPVDTFWAEAKIDEAIYERKRTIAEAEKQLEKDRFDSVVGRLDKIIALLER